jgi:hypothetical protein
LIKNNESDESPEFGHNARLRYDLLKKSGPIWDKLIKVEAQLKQLKMFHLVKECEQNCSCSAEKDSTELSQT